jgi:DUF1680 family protein
MLLIGGEARFADVIEWQLYNAMLSGVSLDGETHFYQNPLADEGNHRRQPWFRTACCPPNVARTLASLTGYLYGVSDAAIWIHLYAEGGATIALPDGRQVRLRQRTRYPWDGEAEIEVLDGGEFALRPRVPGWCEQGATVAVNGVNVDGPIVPGDYVDIRRSWESGDTVRLTLPMPILRVECHPHVAENAGRVALTRGPLLYCVEQADNPGVDLRDVSLPDASTFDDSLRSELLDGVVTLSGRGIETSPDSGWADRLYRTAGTGQGDEVTREVSLTAIPYYAWANREPGRMRVWLPRIR